VWECAPAFGVRELAPAFGGVGAGQRPRAPCSVSAPHSTASASWRTPNADATSTPYDKASTATELATVNTYRTPVRPGAHGMPVSADREIGAPVPLPMNLAPTNPPLTPPRRGTGQPVLLPSWEGLGVGSGAGCAQKVRSGLFRAVVVSEAPEQSAVPLRELAFLERSRFPGAGSEE